MDISLDQKIKEKNRFRREENIQDQKLKKDKNKARKKNKNLMKCPS